MSEIAESSVRAGNATASQSTRGTSLRWEIGTEHIALALEWKADVPLHLSHVQVGEHHSFKAAGEPFFGVRTSTYSFADRSSLPVTDSRVSKDERAVRLEIDLLAMDGSKVTVNLEAHDGQAIVRTWLDVVPSKSLSIVHVEPFRLNVRNPAFAKLHTITGLRAENPIGADGAYASFRLEERPLTESIRLESGARSTAEYLPWAAFTGDDVAAGGLLLGLEYGASWAFTTRPDENGAMISAFLPIGLEPELAAGDEWTSPAVWIGGFTGDLDTAAAATHDYLRAVVSPTRDDTAPAVQYNTWFAHGTDLSTDALVAEAEIAQDLGAEVFVIDAGWWQGNPAQQDHLSLGLGSWTENRQKFPIGLTGLVTQIRERGMQVGLWVEPERVDLRTAATAGWDPEWIAQSGERWIRQDWPIDTDTALLCFGLQDTQDWAFKKLTKLIAQAGVRWLRWDSTSWGICDSPDHDHGVGDGEAAQIAGVHAVIDRLRERYPDLVIEVSAGGAGRFDTAMARHAHLAWLHDASAPSHRARFHAAGASYLYPPDLLSSWVTESLFENLNGQDLPETIVRSLVRSRMIGALGISCQLGTWTAATRRIVAEEIALYKEHVRPLVRHGHLQHLLPQATIDGGRIGTPDTWEAYGLVAKDTSTAVALAFRNASPERKLSLHFKDLEPSELYNVTVEGEEFGEFTGRELVGIGLDIDCDPLASVLVLVERSEG